MADVTLSYKGSDILELSDSGSATLKTGGKYCEDDIAVEYVKPSGGGRQKVLLASGTFTQASQTTFMQIPISFSGTATEGAIVGEPIQDTACTYATYIFNELQAITDSPFRGSITMNAAQTVNNIVVRGYANNALESNRIYMYNNSSGYPIKPGDYKWYIWGYTE